ncbi:hypothetical protein ACJX0J_016286, partial [Zea mays]
LVAEFVEDARGLSLEEGGGAGRLGEGVGASARQKEARKTAFEAAKKEAAEKEAAEKEAAKLRDATASQPSPNSQNNTEDVGVLNWHLDPKKSESEEELAKIRRDRGYSYMDLIEICPDKLENYEEKVRNFFREHMHADEEIRYCLEGSGYFDVRDKDDKWIRIRIREGDMIIVPAGIYHRFTLDSAKYTKLMRLFIGEPVWTPLNRPQEDHPARQEYVKNITSSGLLSSSSSSPIRQAPAIPRSSYRAQTAAIVPDDAGCPPGSRYAAARRAPSSLLSPPYALQDPVEMPRGRRKQTVESNEEYLSEDHVGQKKLQKTLAHESDSEMEEESFAVGGHDQSGEVSEMEPNSKNPTDMDADIEVEDEETNVEVKRRGKTKLLQVWNIPRGHRIVVQCNELDQPIGEEAGIMGKFLGMVARNGNLCSLSYKDWRLFDADINTNTSTSTPAAPSPAQAPPLPPGPKERLTNEQKNKEDILKQVKRRFLYPARMEKWVLKTIGERWRQHKSNLKSIYYDAHKGLEANYNNVPPGVIADQWIALVNHWVTTKAKNDLQELLAEHPEFADTSQGKIAWNGDALNKILGEEKPGHVHGLGLVPNLNKVLDGTTSRRLNQIHVTSLDPTASEDVLSLKLQMEKLINHGCLDDLPANQFPTSSKRKRVCVEPQNQEFRMDNEKTYSQIKVADTRQGKLQRTDRLATTHKLERDITFDNTKLANSSKSMTKEATSTSLNEEVKRKDMQSATTFDKTKCATTSKGTPGDRPTDESIL